MYIALVCVVIFICILLVLVVLSQNSKGGGLSNQFGAGSSNLIGVKRTGDLLEKMTWGFAIALVALSLGSHLIIDESNNGAQPRSINQERASQQNAAPAAAPVVPQTAPTQAPAGGATTTPATTPAPTTDTAQ